MDNCVLILESQAKKNRIEKLRSKMTESLNLFIHYHT